MKIIRLLISSLFLVFFFILFNWFIEVVISGYFQIELSEIVYNIILWILLFPFLLFIAKWYFKQDEPTTTKGAVLGISWIVSLVVLELIWGKFFFGLISYVSFVEIFLISVFAGFEFDSVYSKPRKTT
ncbi:MAG: hypothetical protein ACD_19C00048G0003 [uncultured bacterium]|nr:MAG: hypothetical protein ACD_19C00048G0003 [uncultured bacterium]